MTKTQLKKFLKLRNSSEFTSNLQFQIDADACGFRVSELGKAKEVKLLSDVSAWVWKTEHGYLIELGRSMVLYETWGEFLESSNRVIREPVFH